MTQIRIARQGTSPGGSTASALLLRRVDSINRRSLAPGFCPAAEKQRAEYTLEPFQRTKLLETGWSSAKAVDPPPRGGWREIAQRCACFLFVLLCYSQVSHAAGKVFSIQEFDQIRDRWVGLESTVEGRRSIYDQSLIKLRNSTISFKPTGPLPVLDRRRITVRLTGTLQKEDGRYVFHVREVEDAPNDLEQYQARERDIKKSVPQEWYGLADWVEARGKFYSDPVLLDKARECRRKGFETERAKLPDNDPLAYIELASRTASLGISDSIRQDLIHEAFVIRRKSVLEKPEAVAEKQLLTDMERDLAGSKIPLPADDPALRQKYLANPDSVYEKASAEERKRLHRLLWSSLALTLLEKELAADYHNGFEIAARIDQELPEFHARAETYRDKVLEVRSKQVENLTRAEVLKLRQDFRDRQQVKLGDEAMESWLQWKKKRLKPDDIEGLVNLADQYEELLEQRQTKVRLLLEAVGQHPDAPELLEKLQKMGFRRDGSKWISEAEFLAKPKSDVEKALLDGNIVVGMTAAQVKQSLGVPMSTTRVVVVGQVNEIWSYQSPGSAQPLMIYLSRRLPAAESYVIGVDKLP
ncbi:MAG: hypothetical protein JWM11_1969 [Planctomycetaceae bacterium]|nr:hypothetical protein [Planctomycetaceae bacterium]